MMSPIGNIIAGAQAAESRAGTARTPPISNRRLVE
jgi:hypothetical protein